MSMAWGNFTVFGFSNDPEFILQILPDRLPAPPRCFSFGTSSHLFFSSSCGEIAENEETLVFKSGFVRRVNRENLSARDLLDSRLMHPEGVRAEALRGYALTAAFSKTAPVFSVYKTLLYGSPLYMYRHPGGLFCTDQFRILAAFFDDLEPDESALPGHVIYHAPIGPKTSLRGVRLLMSGECLTVKDGREELRLAKDLRALRDDPFYGRRSPRSPAVFEDMKAVIGSYHQAITAAGKTAGNLLSGGVDSSVTQLLLNENAAGSTPFSCSYRMLTPGFEPEVHYAQQASRALGTRHLFVDVRPEDFIDWLWKANRLLCQPVHSPMEACKLALAEALGRDASTPEYVFHSTSGDTQFGGASSINSRKLEWARRIPGSAWMLRAAARLLPGQPHRSWWLNKTAAIIEDPLHPLAPIHTEAGLYDHRLVTAWFGEDAVTSTLKARSGLVAHYIDSPSIVENTHLAMCLHSNLFAATQESVIFQSQGKELICPYLDEDILRTSFSVPARQRYRRGKCIKPILRDILAEHSACPSARGPKLASSFNPDLRQWMMKGPLHDLARSIERPGFLTPTAFDQLFTPSGFHALWALLTWDLFKKHLRQANR